MRHEKPLPPIFQFGILGAIIALLLVCFAEWMPETPIAAPLSGPIEPARK